MNAKVILVDGPFRGEVREVDSPYQSYLILPIYHHVTLYEAIDPTRTAFETANYQIHRMNLFGEFLLIGSLDALPRECDLFEALASNAAKSAALR